MLTVDERIGKRAIGQPEDKSITAPTFAKIRAAGAVLDAHLANLPFIMGDLLTLANIDMAAPFSSREWSRVLQRHNDIVIALPLVLVAAGTQAVTSSVIQ